MKIKIFKKDNSFKKKDFQLNPNFYWKLVLFFVLLFTLASLVFGYYRFLRLNQEPILEITGNSGQVPKINKDRILKVLNYFLERDKKSIQILNTPAPVVDPSR